MARGLKAYIDHAALQHNLACVRACTHGKSILAMIKANGYGHGLLTTAKALPDVEALGVACIEEATRLRKANIPNRIILMEGFFHAEDELPEIIRLGLECVVHHPGHLSALQNTHFEKPISIWIKINTGMHRLGFQPQAFPAVWSSIQKLPQVKVMGFLTHFAKADELDKPETANQIAQFKALTKDLPGIKSLANSAGILGWKESHGDMVRPGIMLYGVSPFAGRSGQEEGLKPVMRLCSEIIAIQAVKKGDAIGYGGIFICPKDMLIGVVAVGYGDGYPRLAPEGTPVLVKGVRASLVGRVSMDMITVDLTNVPSPQVSDPVELWGPSLPVEEVARFMGTIGYELLTSLSVRVPFEIQY